MSISWSPRGAFESPLHWRLRKPFSWSAPHGWGWEGPDAVGSNFTLWGARRDCAEAHRLLREGKPIPDKWLPQDLLERRRANRLMTSD
jgi:hypothetical protein